jgi:hypothetical protein
LLSFEWPTANSRHPCRKFWPIKLVTPLPLVINLGQFGRSDVLVVSKCCPLSSFEKTKERMRSRPANFTQSHAKRLFKAAAAAAAAAGVDVRVEFRPDGTIIATAHKPAEVNGADALPSDAPEEVRKLI